MSNPRDSMTVRATLSRTFCEAFVKAMTILRDRYPEETWEGLAGILLFAGIYEVLKTDGTDVDVGLKPDPQGGQE